jgi:AAA15 family ATPase/GTPase
MCYFRREATKIRFLQGLLTMIVEIRLENFFSIKDEVVLDFRAGNINTQVSQSLAANAIEYKGNRILKSIGLFGANASGKSNIIKAINFCCRLILDSHLYNEGVVFGFSPFKFDLWSNKPSSFLIDFFCDGVEYEYSFALTRTEIVKESLYYFPNGRKAKIFIRDESKGPVKKAIYSFAEGVIPSPVIVAENTSKKTLFLSRASQMDRELCKKLYRFFVQDFILGFVPINQRWPIQLFEQYKELVLHVLSICDSDIVDIKVIQEKIAAPLLPPGVQLPGYPQGQEVDSIRFETFHSLSPTTAFDMRSEESTGTTQLFNMLFLLLDVVRNGKALMLDEFDLSLHTKLADFVIDLFHAGSKAQFLFTSHNTNLIDVKRFRRDQILFANKKSDGSTEVYSLFDHKDFRENMDAEKGYLQGRFDAIPYVDSSVANLKKLLGNTGVL